jgi:hypothetical protein
MSNCKRDVPHVAARSRALAAALLVAGALIAHGAKGQTFHSANLDVGLPPRFSAIGHVDGDGILDVVIAAAGSEISVNMGLGHGVFAPPKLLPVEAALEAIALVDLNEDGLSDLVVSTAGATGTTTLIVVRLSLGDGTFGPPSYSFVPNGPPDIAAADLDGDGHVDLVLPCFWGQQIAVLHGQGDGTFNAMGLFATNQRPDVVAIGDLNGDTLPDVLVGSSIFDFSVPDPTGVSVLLNDGAGGLVATVTPPFSKSVHHVALGDVNGDGKLDAILCNDGTFLMAGLGAGQLAAPVQLDTGFTDVEGGVVAADFDEDGDDDLALAGYSISVLQSHGDLTFDPLVDYGVSGTDAKPIAADLNGDGDLDLLAAGNSYANHWVTILDGRGDCTFGPNFSGGQNLAFGDLDGDGRQDMVTSTGMAGPGQVLVFHGLGLGGFVQTASFAAGQLAKSIVLADFDENGSLDIAVTNGYSSLSLFFGDGNGGFGPLVPVALPPTAGPRQMRALDVNHDEHVDLVVLCGVSQYALDVALGNGDGTFQPLLVTPIAASPVAFTMADFNVDGHVDAAVTTPGAAGALLQIFLGTGTGAFDAPLTTTSGGISGVIASGDLDGDQVPDLATTHTLGLPSAPYILYVHIANGDGTFGPAQPVTLPGIEPVALGVADFDGDGKNDVVCALSPPDDPSPLDGFGNELALLHGHGDGAFGTAELASAGPTTMLAVADIDGDGALDVGLGGGWLLFNQLGPWDVVGYPLAGTLGLPKQTGEGSLQPGSKFVIALHDARPLTPAAQVVGLAAINAPFQGGTLVPDADLVISPLFTDAAGDVELSGDWPLAGLSGLSLYLQFWIPDPAGVQGWSSTAGLQATLP